VYLEGRGLRLVPSLFLGDRPAVLIETGHREDSPVLVYQALTDPDTIGALWHGYEPDPHALGALVGRTRAAALQALRASCSTSELGNRLGVSTAAASQHATVLRNAGLITTRRRRNAVFHSLTPLGVALVDLGARPCDQVKAAWAFGD
jgi:DNA-binding transcriptional ArsR family regulator